MKHLNLTDDNNKDGMNRIWGRAHALGTSEERVTLDARLADGGGVTTTKGQNCRSMDMRYLQWSE